jgi:hypothetical protein
LHLRERFDTLAAVVNFLSFRVGKFLRRAKTIKNKKGVSLFATATASPQRYKENTKRWDPKNNNSNNGSEASFRTGEGTLGGKRKGRTVRGVIGRVGMGIETRRT